MTGELDERWARATSRLPHQPLSREAFADRIAKLDPPPHDLHTADLYLAAALAAGDAKALAIAETELMPVARRAIGRIDAAPQFVEEVAQRVRDHLFVRDGRPPAIEQYRGAAPLVRWVGVVASRFAVDAKRVVARSPEVGDEALETLPAPDDPELAAVWRRCAAEYRAALTAAFATLTKRERNLLRQRYVDDLNIDALGRLYDVHPATAFRWLKRVEQRLADATRAAVMAKLALSDSEARSMERVIAGQIEISITRLLRRRG